VALIAIWKGFSSPGMANGTSYAGWNASVGIDFFRPVITAFYTAVYFLPFTFPAMKLAKTIRRWWAIAIALAGGIAAGYEGSFLIQPGPLNTIVHKLGRGPAGESMLLGLLAALAIYNALAVAELLWEKGASVQSNPPAVFAILVVVFFVAEQIGVGGNVPLFERYMLQIAPFVGMIAFSLFPRLTRNRALALFFMALVTQIMLWRFAFVAGGL
jgi:hypothetical protein